MKRFSLALSAFFGFLMLCGQCVMGQVGGVSADSLRAFWPDNIDSVYCDVQPSASEWGIMLDWSSADTVSPLLIPLVGDIDGDGTPEIVCFAPNYTLGFYGATQVLVFNSLSHSVTHRLFLPSPVSTVDAAPYAIAKLPNGHVILAVCMMSGTMQAYDLSAHSSSPLWSTDVELDSPNVGFADFNADSVPEIYVGNRVYNAVTGTLLAQTDGGNIGASFAHNSDYRIASSCVADMDGDMRPELILGNAIYSVSITNTSGTAGNSMSLLDSVAPPLVAAADGHAQVADFNLDGFLDVLITSKASPNGLVGMYIWDVHNGSVSTPFFNNVGGRGKSIPLIADIDDDGQPEVVLQCYFSGNKVRAFKYDTLQNSFSELWSLWVDEDSYSNSMTFFDFNHDGLGELLITDQSSVRIVNGSGKSHITGNDTLAVYTLTSMSFGECTVMQYPVVADVDADGSAELVACGLFGEGHTYQAHLNVFRSSTGAWAPARKVWNQYMYNVTGINEDLSVRPYLFNNATVFVDSVGTVRRPYNNFLQQATTIDQFGRPYWPVADVAPLHVERVASGGDSAMFVLTYCNSGAARFNAPYGIALYSASGALLLVDTVSRHLQADSCRSAQLGVPLDVLCDLEASDSLVFVVGDFGDGSPWGGRQSECDTSNNAIALALHDVGYRKSSHTVLSVCDSLVWDLDGNTYFADTLLSYTLLGESNCDSVVFLHVNVMPSPQLQHIPDTVLEPGSSLTLHASGASMYSWKNSDGATLSNDSVLTVTPSSSTTYFLTAFNSGDNLVYNGDFELGNLGFASDYIYSSNLYPGGVYCIGTDAHDFHVGFYGSHDHTSDTGNYMIVNGAAGENTVLWSQTLSVLPNTNYAFSVWATNVSPYSDFYMARMLFSINDEPLGDIFQIPTDLNTWSQFYEVWYSDTATSATITILNMNTNLAGNDFGIDDIRFTTLTTCQSFDTVHVFVGQHLDTAVCSSSFPLVWHGVTFSRPEARQLFVSGNGEEDSVLILNVSEIGSTQVDYTAVVCDSLVWSDSVYTQSGDYVSVLTSSGGCDSTVALHLTVNPSYNVVEHSSVCETQLPFSWCDTTIGSAASGDNLFTVRRTTVASCDSVLTLSLFVRGGTRDTVQELVLENSLPFVWHGYSFWDDVSDSLFVISDSVNCDSVVLLSLSVVRNVRDSVTRSVCDSELPLTWNGISFTQAGVQQATLTAASGADSIVTMTLVVNQSYEFAEQLSLCSDDLPLSWSDTTISSVASLGTPQSFFLHRVSSHGCDSNLSLSLVVNPSFEVVENRVGCEPLTWLDGITYDSEISGPQVTLHTVYGCDSVITLDFRRSSAVETHVADTFCVGGVYHFGGMTISQGGLYYDTLMTTAQCDSIVVLSLTALDLPAISISDKTDCATLTHNLTVTSNAPHLWWRRDDGGDWNPDWGPQNSNSVWIRYALPLALSVTADYSDVAVCPSSQSITVTPVVQPEAIMEVSPEALSTEQPTLTAVDRSRGAVTRSWSIDDVPFGDSPRIEYSPDITGMDSLRLLLVAYADQCVDTAMRIVPIVWQTLFAPNAFTPDESANRVFSVYMEGVVDFKLRIYNRQGILVFESDSPDGCWDGTYGGKPCPQGTYVWIATYHDVTAPRYERVKKGTVTLLR